MSAPAIQIRGLIKDYPVKVGGMKLRAVDHLDLNVEAGQVYGLLGPNGSGKSTTIKVILGLLAPTAGDCRVFGISSHETAARCHVGYLPEAPYFYRFLTGTELVRFYAKMCGVHPTKREARVREVIDWVGMNAAATRQVGTYSKGMLQRIGLAQALVHDPRLVILDEPTAGVDPIGAAAIATLILRLKAEGKTVLITSHLISQIEEICDRVAILNHGKLVVEGSVAELVSRSDRQALTVTPLSTAELVELRGWLAARGHSLDTVEAPRGRLDQLFVQKVTGTSVDGGGESPGGGK